MSDRTLSAPVVGALVVVFLLSVLFYLVSASNSLDPREPPVAPESLPVIGHIVGLSRQSFNYAVQISSRISAPIFTLPLPGQKIYVITKPYLIPLFERQTKILAFGSFETKLSAKLAGATPVGSALVQLNANDEGSLNEDSRNTFLDSLRPGIELDKTNTIVSREIVSALDSIQPDKGQFLPIGLYAWLRLAITRATTNAIFGPANPFKKASMGDAFWEYEKGVTNIFVSPFPSITARGPIAAREKLVAAFIPYIANGHFNQASVAIRNHVAFQRRWNMPLEDIARFEVLASIGFLVNTVAASFAVLVLIYMDSGELLNDIRNEVSSATRIDGKKRIIDLGFLRERCPLLLATLRETLRYRSCGTSIREVMEDTELDGFLLKKGALVQLPSRVIHLDRDAWGEDADKFNPRRFTQSTKTKQKDTYFRALGGGKKLCPGRHFATNEILALIAVFTSRFEMRPTNGKLWKEPSTLKTDAGSFQMQPDWDIHVEIQPRKGTEEVEWEVDIKDTGSVAEVVAEDKAH